MNAILEAHLKLLGLLPVRFVPAKVRPSRPDPKVMGRPGRPIEVEGVRYPSVRDAHRMRKCSAKTIYRLLDKGAARYV